MDGLIAYALSKKYVDGKTSSLATGMSWKGTKENVSSLPQFGNQVGDLWHVNEDGNKYAWNGSQWELLSNNGASLPTVSSSDNGKVLGVVNGAWSVKSDEGGSVTVDSALSTTSENPVQNKVIKAALDAQYVKPSGGIPASDLASGVIPVVPTMATQTDMSDWTSGKTVDAATLKTDFQSALYTLDRLSDAVYSHTGEIFDLQAGKADKTDIPIAVSELTNDSGFQTAQQVQTAIAAIPAELPTVSSTDNGKFLLVVNGAWAAANVPSAETNSFGGGS